MRFLIHCLFMTLLLGCVEYDGQTHFVADAYERNLLKHKEQERIETIQKLEQQKIERERVDAENQRILEVSEKNYNDFIEKFKKKYPGKTFANLSLSELLVRRKLDNLNPKLKEVYIELESHSYLTVSQSISGGVLAMVQGVGGIELVKIETSKDYSDGDILKDGLYEYVGNFSYTSVLGSTKKVWSFKDLKR